MKQHLKQSMCLHNVFLDPLSFMSVFQCSIAMNDVVLVEYFLTTLMIMIKKCFLALLQVKFLFVDDQTKAIVFK
jgi:hypothetical protein